MKYIKFEKIQTGENPIIRMTYKNWYGKLVTRDIVKACLNNYWQFMDNSSLIYDYESINTFYNNTDDEYIINGA